MSCKCEKFRDCYTWVHCSEPKLASMAVVRVELPLVKLGFGYNVNVLKVIFVCDDPLNTKTWSMEPLNTSFHINHKLHDGPYQVFLTAQRCLEHESLNTLWGDFHYDFMK